MVYMKKKLKVSSCYTRDKDTIENTNSIILPRQFLEHIVKKKLEKYFFKVHNLELGIISYCSVMEFSAPDDHVIMPFWLMEYLAIDENSQVEIEVVNNIIKGTKVVLEPLNEEFFNIPESDVILESVLSKFSLLHYNSVIKVDIMDKKYLIKIKDIEHDYSSLFNNDEAENNNGDNDVNQELLNINTNVIDIINVDLGVELYNSFLAKKLEKRKQEEIERKKEEEIQRKKKEEEMKNRQLQKAKEKSNTKTDKRGVFVPFSGKGNRLGD